MGRLRELITYKLENMDHLDRRPPFGDSGLLDIGVGRLQIVAILIPKVFLVYIAGLQWDSLLALIRTVILLVHRSSVEAMKVPNCAHNDACLS